MDHASTSARRIVILGGGTMNHVRSHLALCAPAFGSTARKLHTLFSAQIHEAGLGAHFSVETMLTKMADHESKLVTNADVEALVETLIADPSVKSIIFNIALADFEGRIGSVPSGSHAERLRTAHGPQSIDITPSPKLIGRIRKERKDIFLIGFKTTAGETRDVQYARGLELLKTNSVNLVLANDTVTRNNVIIAPEETRYAESTDRDTTLAFLASMALSRMQNHFTRSTVVEGSAIDWRGPLVPDNLRQVVDHCIARGAYKPVLGKTAGHFAVKVDHGRILTSIRKSNFNQLDRVGLVQVDSAGDDQVIAHGFRPSVGGQSQRIIFKEHADLDCIVHFHCPPLGHAPDKALIPVKAQWPNECGSHECGRQTSAGLREVDLGDGDKLSVVFLDNHGPNIVFNRKTPASKVVGFIERNFDLAGKTGGMVSV
jgi:hypothetical protein